MRQGESLNRFDAQESWFPPRPVIEKDEKALSKLYGGTKRRVKAKKEKKRNLATVSHLNGTHN